MEYGRTTAPIDPCPATRARTHARGWIAVTLALTLGCLPTTGAAARPNTSTSPSTSPTAGRTAPRADVDGRAADERRAQADEIRDRTAGQARIVADPISAVVSFLGGSALHPLAPAATGDPVEIARAFVDRYAALFGTDDAASLIISSHTSTASGGTAVRFAQTIGGLSVLAAEIVVRVGADGEVLSASGELSTAAAAGAPFRSDPVWSRADAVADAIADTAATERVDARTLVSGPADLTIYDASLLDAGASPGRTLVWSVPVHDDPADAPRGVSQRVLVDAGDGHVTLALDTDAGAKSRRVCDDANNASNPETCASTGPLVARTEGQAATGRTDVDLAYDLAGVTYDFYWTVLGRDSIDGLGMPLVSTVRYCESPTPADCPSTGASWNGTQMVYGAGWAGADDIVGHEFTHGFTDRTAGLFHYGESGAIAESISDVMGELIDQQSTVSGADPSAERWKIGEQLPGGAIRNMADPTLFNDPDRMTSTWYAGSIDDSHGVHTNSGVGDKAAYLIAAGTSGEPSGQFNGQAITAIGNVKTAKVYAEAVTSLLGPGSDYADLFALLPQACTNLIGAGGLTTTDCDQVLKAVIATEMDHAPVTPGSQATAPICDTGKVVTSRLFDDDMETSSLPKWSRPTPSNPAARWTSFAGSSESGTRSLHGPNVGDALTADATLATSVLIPTGTSTFLRFSHSFAMEADLAAPPYSFYDGGVVQYTTNGGASWTDAANLPGTVNGYPGDAVISGSSDNPLAGLAVFSGTSAGYEQTRINLSSLAGNSLKVRFRVGTDGLTGWDGWFIDDVSIYTCDPPSAPDAPTSLGAVGGHHAASLTWTAPASNGGAMITSYHIVPTKNGVPQPPIDTPDGNVSYQVTGLTNGATYTFTVAATNSVGAGAPSSASNSVTPAPGPPWQPTSVAATRGDTQATVVWTTPGSDGGSVITNYIVTPYIGASAQTPVTTPTTATTVTVTGLANATAYTFRVQAVNATNTGPPSLASNAVTPAGVPDPPIALNPFAGQLSASLSWTAPLWNNGDSVTAYVITPYIGAVAQTPVTTPTAATAYTVTGLIYNEYYTFRIAAMNAVGVGANSVPSVAVVPQAQLTNAPTSVAASRGDHMASVSWVAPSFTGGAPIDHYVVTPFVGAAAQTPTTTLTNATTIAIGGLTNGTAYTFTVVAVNPAGPGPSSTASASVIPAGAPGPAMGVTAVPRHRSIDLSWSQPSQTNGAAVIAYVITPYRSGIPQPAITTPTAIETFTVTGLINGQQYTFTVTALNPAGTSVPSALSPVVTPVGPPDAPTAITGTRGDGTVSLQWISPIDTGGRPITNYVITPYVDGVARTATITPSSATAFALSSLTNGTQYTFKVAAVNNVGSGPESSDFIVLTPAGSPGVPTAVQALAGNGAMLVAWTTPTSDGGAPIVGFIVTTFLDGVPITTNEAPGTALSLVVTGLDRHKKYSFSVTAKNATGLGTPSSQTPPTQPTKTGFTAAGPDRIFDTRPGESPAALRQVAKTKVGGANVLEVKVTDLPGLVPSSGVGAVSLNVVATNPDASGFVTVFPCGERKLVASVNYAAGQTVANAVVAPVSASGTVCFYSLAPTDLIVDLNGWFAADSNFAAVGPDRVFDTRPGESPSALRSVAKVPVGGDNVLQVQVTALGSLVPAANVGAVSLNVAVTNPAAAGFVTVFPCGERKLVASVNFLKGQTVANAVIAPVSASGTVCFYSLVPTDLIVDLNGWFAAGSDFSVVGPDRVLDTRAGESPLARRAVEKQKIGGVRILEVKVAGIPGMTPDTGVGAVSLNVAVTNPDGAGYITVFPCGERKLVASLNYSKGQTVANAVVAPVSAVGTVCFYSLAATDIIVDINGWFPTAD